MKTTIDIPEKVLKEAMDHSGAETKREAVLCALEEYNRRRRMARLAGKLGTFKRFMSRKDLDRSRSE
jgi:Arc/MetJ family transcription regulator